MTHEHKAKEPLREGQVYEECECGAIRKSPIFGSDYWHVCSICVKPDFKWVLSLIKSGAQEIK